MSDNNNRLCLYRIQYTISPTDKNIDLRLSREKIRRQPYLKKSEEKNLLRKLTHRCLNLGHSGCSNEVLFIAKDGVAVESQLLQNIPPLPDRSEVKINFIERVTDDATTKNTEGDTNGN